MTAFNFTHFTYSLIISISLCPWQIAWYCLTWRIVWIFQFSGCGFSKSFVLCNLFLWSIQNTVTPKKWEHETLENFIRYHDNFHKFAINNKVQCILLYRWWLQFKIPFPMGVLSFAYNVREKANKKTSIILVLRRENKNCTRIVIFF